MRWSLLLVIFAIASCGRTPKTPELCATWYANAKSIGYLNIQRMALDLRADSTYRYFYIAAPPARQKVGQEVTEGGVFHVKGDSLIFYVEERNGEKVDFIYGRPFRMLPDTTEWPLRVYYSRRGVDFEVYFKNQEPDSE
jgi:hypothetical protein